MVTGGQLVWIDQEGEQTDQYGWWFENALFSHKILFTNRDGSNSFETAGSRAEPLRFLEDHAVLNFCASVGASLHQRVVGTAKDDRDAVSNALPTRVEAFVYNNAYHDTPTISQWPTTFLQEQTL